MPWCQCRFNFEKYLRTLRNPKLIPHNFTAFSFEEWKTRNLFRNFENVAQLSIMIIWCESFYCTMVRYPVLSPENAVLGTALSGDSIGHYSNQIKKIKKIK